MLTRIKNLVHQWTAPKPSLPIMHFGQWQITTLMYAIEATQRGLSVPDRVLLANQLAHEVIASCIGNHANGQADLSHVYAATMRRALEMVERCEV